MAITYEDITKILDGIDKDGYNDGWWETSTGAEFGVTILAQIKELFDSTGRENWLHGWRRDSNSVLMGTCSFCIGCGREVSGPICVVFPENWVPPPEPSWPFEKSNCPVCDGHYTKQYMEISSKEITAEAIAKLPWELLRIAIQIKKRKKCDK